MNASTRAAVSNGVDRTTVRRPTVALAAIEMLTTAEVGLTTWTLLTVTPGPKSAAVTPWMKCVFVPVTATLSVSP